jgi:hypothetical protein
MLLYQLTKTNPTLDNQIKEFIASEPDLMFGDK